MNIQDIEQIYATNVKTPAFIILANYYYEKKLYSHAQKICEEGLIIYPYHNHANYIVAKINLLHGKIKSAEKILKKIINKDAFNIKSLLLLLKVMEFLNRSPKSIASIILKGNKYYYFHPTVQKYYKKYIGYINKTKPINKTNKEKIKNTIDKTSLNINFKLNEKLATKTMYKLYLSQKKYNLAKTILEMMKNKNKNIDFVSKEMKTVVQLINEEQK